MENVIKTIDGTAALKSECHYSRGMYFKIGDNKIENSGQIYYFPKNDKFYRSTGATITYDHNIKEYVIKKEASLREGVVGVDGDALVFGNYSREIDTADPVVLSKGNVYPCMNDLVFKDSIHFLEDLTTGAFHPRGALDSIRFTRPAQVSEEVKRNLPYDSRGLTKPKTRIYNKLYKPIYNKTVNKYGAAMGDLSFGLEFETTKGFIPERITDRLGLIGLRDGSIEGLEYVTIPLQGKKGIQTVIDSLDELKKRTRFDNSCALHLHLGNIPRTEEFFLALYKTLVLMQDSVYEMFPLHKKYNYGVKRKHYTKPLDYRNTLYLMDPVINRGNLTKNFSILYTHLSMGQHYGDVGNDLNNVKVHPSDPKGTSKWNIKTRYHWVNLIPLLFGNKQTVEFRIHTPTYDTNKIINFMLICGSIVNFTIKHMETILTKPQNVNTLSLHDMIQDLFYKGNNDAIIGSLFSYIDDRKSFIQKITRDGDLVGEESKMRCRSRYMNWSNESASTKKIYKGRSNPYRVFEDIVAQEPGGLIGVDNDFREFNGAVQRQAGAEQLRRGLEERPQVVRRGNVGNFDQF
tara:strand:- start:48146 stop:49867 length:1722 start_codon:yes stop_codon:yes gene_type:complete